MHLYVFDLEPDTRRTREIWHPQEACGVYGKMDVHVRSNGKMDVPGVGWRRGGVLVLNVGG